jgi:hypothetical protein
MDESATNYLKELENQVKYLERRIEELALENKKMVKNFLDWDELYMERRLNLIERERADSLERIQNIEFKIFPNLIRDLDSLEDIIGVDENRRDNQLDRRKS